MAVHSNDWVGITLPGNRYRVDAKLGEGGMGYVYKVWDGNLDTDVVIKVPRRAMLEEPEFASRFAREMRSLVNLQHVNIVRVTDLGEHDGLPYAVMQYYPGGDLEGRLTTSAGGRSVPAHPSTLSSWLPGVAKALDFIHPKGYIHRDVKPANILFDLTGHPILSDFGIAKVLDSAEVASRRGATITGAGIVLGTPDYMAPELIMGEPFDGRVDQYALAVTAYEAVCARKPFTGDNATAIMVRQTSNAPPPLVELPEAGSEAIARVILKALSKDPSQRFETCGAFANALIAAAAEAGDAPVSLIPDRLTCPSCGKTSPIPSAILGNPSQARGRKTACPSCRAALRFADDRLTLILADRSAATSSGTMVIVPSTRTPAPATLIERRAETLPPPVERTAQLSVIAKPPRPEELEEVALLQASEPIGFLALQDSRPPSKPLSMPWVIGGAGVATLAVLVLAFAYFSGGPAVSKSPRKNNKLLAKSNSEMPPKNEPKLEKKDEPEPKPKLKPDPVPPPKVEPKAEDKSLTPPKPDPTPKQEPTPSSEPTPDPAEEKANDDEKEPLNPRDKRLPILLRELVNKPAQFAGQVITPTELLAVNTQPIARPGPYEGLAVESKDLDFRVRKPDAIFDLVLPDPIATHIREAIRDRKVGSGRYAGILTIRVDKDPSRSGSYVGVVERVNFLLQTSYKEIGIEHYSKAFQQLVVTSEEAKIDIRDGDEWRRRMPNEVNRIRKMYKDAVANKTAAILNQGERMAAASAANASAFIQNQQKEQDQLIRNLFGRK